MTLPAAAVSGFSGLDMDDLLTGPDRDVSGAGDAPRAQRDGPPVGTGDGPDEPDAKEKASPPPSSKPESKPKPKPEPEPESAPRKSEAPSAPDTSGDSGDAGDTRAQSGDGSAPGSGDSDGSGASAPDPAPEETSPAGSERQLPGTEYYDWTKWVPGMR